MYGILLLSGHNIAANTPWLPKMPRLSACAIVPAMWLSPPFSYSVMEVFVPGKPAAILDCKRGSSLIGPPSTALVIQEFSVYVGSHKLRGLCTIACTCAAVRFAPVMFVTRVVPLVF